MERKSSIESEPRTLNFSQIQFAREVALYVMNNKSMEEALTIFSEGLEPVKSVARQKRIVRENSGEFDCIQDQTQLPHLVTKLRDIASAPF